MNMIGLIINLVAGAVGGNLAGAAFKNINLGTLGNSIAGVIGGGLGGWLLGYTPLAVPPGAAMGIGSIVSAILSGGVGGGVLMAIVGFIKQSAGQKK
jgi:uncharacterized membrane protein YeaQ/YmgE (transglycosylase-associated protein family)